MDLSNLFCRVCGLRQLTPPWGSDGRSPTFEICACCGAEFGYEDITPGAAKKFRDKWLADGMNWFTPEDKPADWSWELQSEKIPKEFR